MSGSDAPRSGKKTPESPARVELVCTGAELLSGHTTNTHARLLGEQLGPLGLALSRETSVPDQVSEIIAAVREARNRAEVVFVTGGLGPTSDDVTREALAELFGCGMVVDPVALTVIHERCARTGREPTPSRERQALILENATALANSAGLAPGEWIERPDGLLILLPGPPREFRAVLLEEVLPRLRNRFPNLAFRQAVFRICGLAESDLVEALQREGFDAGRAEFACC
ncbi:MAG: competence/damage-inducible protein A, partial [Kiritimatiellia bacterium]|nr:competence/damage-inducible protein A [Kiritimatiellia bacterium]